jgi:prolyl oligopeptidase
MPPAVVAPPPTPVEPVTEILHGVEVTDPYRWLEDQNSPRTRAWLEDQAAYTRAYLDAIPSREQIKDRAKELMTFKEVISEPWNVGDRYFFLKRIGKGEQPAIVMRNGQFGEETVLLDPESYGRERDVAFSIAAISQDARFLAYLIRSGGTDHSALQILDIERNTVLPDRLPEGFCTGFAFARDGSGYYFSHRALGESRPHYQAVLYHSFGSADVEDSQVFFAGEKPDLFIGIVPSFASNVLIYVVFVTGRSRAVSIYLHNLSSGTAPIPLLENIKGSFEPFFVQERLFGCTDVNAENCRIVEVDLHGPDPRRWHDIVPETGERIQQVAVAGNQMFVTRVQGFSTKIAGYSLEGDCVEVLDFPGTVELLNRPSNSRTLFYTLSSIAKPPLLQCYDTQLKASTTWGTNCMSGPLAIEVIETTYQSADGVWIPLFLAARKGLLSEGPLPTFLTGYGGFGLCVTPRFSAFATFLLQQGLLLAVPAIRGGSELGEKWHQAGKRELRQKSFDDFVAAAEFLLTQGRSSPGRIAIGGGSNAGLLVGAAITQRPDLFRAAICLGPLLDMIRYQLFDFAAGWADEYGSAEVEGDFKYLLDYSPYRQVKENTAYPATLIVSGDSDTRCNPMHARKMTARLQAANRSHYPILLDYKAAWGHTPVQPLSAKIDALTDRLAFICNELAIHV